MEPETLVFFLCGGGGVWVGGWVGWGGGGGSTEFILI
jgi:hypothetical protein